MIIKLGVHDNVGVATDDIPSGNRITQFDITANEPILLGHKVALTDIYKDQPIIKYNQIIGFALIDISSGDHVHTHNVVVRKYNLINRDVDYKELLSSLNLSQVKRNFDGYLRSDGKVGTRNYIGVMSTVNCVSTVVRKIVNSFNDHDYSECNNFDGIVPITHSLGCGHVIGKEDIDILIRVMIGYISHPNFYSLVIVGLGCEDNQISELLERLPSIYQNKIKYLIVSECGGTESAVDQGKRFVYDMIEQAKLQKRSSQPVSHLSIALQCGGSDAFSGVSSNPVLGYASDQIVTLGGTSILSETPEMHGAENLIINRIRESEVVAKLEKKLRWWDEYFAHFGTTFDSNPAPGNKKGGITTIYEKSLGSTSKSGFSEIVDVIDYASPIKNKGLFIMDSPGYDPVSVTGQIAAGANIVCFTTGRGSTIGFKPSPCIKIASNSSIYNSMMGDMDFNCGGVIDGEISINDLGKQLFELIINTASGKQTLSELQSYGDNEFNPWHLGPVN